MAETKTKTNVSEKKETKVIVRLPLNEGHNANQQEFFSVNGKNYLIRRGEDVEVPLELKEVIDNGNLAAVAAYRYVEELQKQENEKKAFYGLNG